MMKLNAILCFVYGLGLLASDGETFRTDINPALTYYRALLMAPEPMSEADRSYLESKKAREQKLPERFGKIVAESDRQFELVRQAAHATVPCDWGMDLSAGPNVAFPQLGRARAVCRTAQLRAVWGLEHGRQNDARDDLIASFVLARNLGSDRLLINAIVQYAIESLEYSTLAQHFGDFGPDTLKQLVEGFDAAPARLTISGCLPSEKQLGDWLVTKVHELQKAYPGDDTRAMNEFRDSVAPAYASVGYTDLWPRVMTASGGTTEGVLKLLRETEPLFERVAKIMALPQPEYETQVKEFSAELRKSANPFFATFDMFAGWAFGRERVPFRSREFKVQAELAMIHAAVAYKLSGETGFKSVTDPFGNGPFGFRRFMFKGVDRGFEVKSAYAGAEAPFVMIFVEKQGTAFEVIGPDAGKELAR